MDKETLKADIFHQPVAFSLHEVTEVSNAQEEALSASLNKFGRWTPVYALLLPRHFRRRDAFELHGRFTTILGGEYEIAEKFISGNVVAASERIGQYLLEHPEDTKGASLLAGTERCHPEPIPFVDLDFNFEGAMDSRKSLLRLCLVPLRHGGDDTLPQFKCGRILSVEARMHNANNLG